MIAKSVDIPVSEWHTQRERFSIKIYKLPIEEWSTLSRKALRNDLHVFDGSTISILRNGRGVRLKAYVRDAIKDIVGEDITRLNEEIKRYQGLQSAARNQAGKSTSEAKATESDPFQMKPLDVALTSEEQSQMDANLRGLAVTMKREDESDDDVFERIKSSKYIISFQHDEYWPFYHVDHKYGRVILTINTAHPFFTELYEPIKRISQAPRIDESEDGLDGTAPDTEEHGPVVALELLLLSLARTQSRLSLQGDEARQVLDLLRREWSETYRVQLTA